MVNFITFMVIFVIGFAYAFFALVRVFGLWVIFGRQLIHSFRYWY